MTCLKSSYHAIIIPFVEIPALLYAYDSLLLLSHTPIGLQYLLESFSQYYIEGKWEINNNKS